MRIKVVLSNERLITPSGLTFVGEMLKMSGLSKAANGLPNKKRSEAPIKNGEILTTYIGLLAKSNTQFEAVDEWKDDPEFYEIALGIKRIPSKEILRQRIDDLAAKHALPLRKIVLDSNAKLFKTYDVKVGTLPCGYAPVDVDVTPMDNSKTKKEGVSWTYKKFNGYAPIMSYIGTHGYLANLELREGSQHCQKGTPAFLRETLKYAHQITDEKLLIRMDSGNDAAENLGILLDDGSHFIIKRNLRSESPDNLLESIRNCCENITEPRPGKTVFIGSMWREIEYIDSDGKLQKTTLRMTYEITERTVDKHGQGLLFPTVEASLLWTNLGLTDDEIIQLYCDHGESEQYHSEIKTDMDVERLPSGKFATNSLVLELVILAFNILRIMGQAANKSGVAPETKHPVKRRRIRTVIDNLIQIAGHVTTHARQTILALGRSNVWRHAFVHLWQQFAPNG
jgi:hypothetical protein